MKHKRYTITKVGDNYQVKTPKGRLWLEEVVSIQMAKRWINGHLTWERCNSTTTGGRPYFWLNRTLKFWVCWHRFNKAWFISDWPSNKCSDETPYKTARAAMKAAEQISD